MGLLRFLWAVVWRDVGVVPRLLQAFFVGLPGIMGTLGSIFEIEALSLSMTRVIGLTLVAFLVIAVGRMTWRAYQLESALEPRVSISDPIGSAFPKRLGNSKALRFYSITITNLSSGNLKNCRVKMVGFVNKRKEAATELGMLFRLSRERHSEIGNHTFAPSFDLNGKDDLESVDIVCLDEKNDGSKVRMQYATASTERVFHELPRGLFPHWLTVRVTADNMVAPATKTFIIEVNGNGQLSMKAANEEPA